VLPGRKRILTHLRVSKRTSWQHLSASPTFPMMQNASSPLGLDTTVRSHSDLQCTAGVRMSWLASAPFLTLDLLYGMHSQRTYVPTMIAQFLGNNSKLTF